MRIHNIGARSFPGCHRRRLTSASWCVSGSRRSTPQASSCVAALLTSIGLVDEQIPGSYGEDYDWLLRAARRRPIVAVEQPLVEVYWHWQSFFAERWEAIADALAYLLGKHPELRADRQGLARIQGQIAFAQAAWRVGRRRTGRAVVRCATTRSSVVPTWPWR